MLPSTFQNEVLQQSQMYQANEAWAQKLSGEGYTVVDIGNVNQRWSECLPFYRGAGNHWG